MQATINNRANMTANSRTSGNISASPSTGVSGTTDYEVLTNKPSINGHELTGNQTGHDLGLANLNDIPYIPSYNLIVIKLFENNTGSPITNISLSDSINNYRIILISGICDTDNRSYRMTACYTPNELKAGLSGTLLRWAPSDEYANFDIIDDTHINVFQYRHIYINAIYGFKLGAIV